VVLELPDILVLYKPPAWQVDTQDVGPIGHRLSEFLQAAVAGAGPSRAAARGLGRDRSHAFGLVTRLDTPSSGLLLAATTYEAYYSLRWQFAEDTVERDYVCLLHGWMDPSVSHLSADIGYARAQGTVPTQISDGGRRATTFVKVLAHGAADASSSADAGTRRVSLVAVRIGTGRRHQIRAHVAHAGHPVVGDTKYSDERQDFDWCPRNFLHRYHLAFQRVDGSRFHASASLPLDLTRVLAALAPCGPASARALQEEWRVCGGSPRSWDELEPLPFSSAD